MLVKLKNYLDVKRGPGLPSEFYSEKGTLIRLTLGNFNYPSGGFKQNTSKKDIYYIGPIKDEYILNKDDLITPLTEQVVGLLGETAWIPESNKYIQNGDIGLVIPIESKLNKKYCYYLLSSPLIKKQLSAGAQQTKIRHTSPDKIKDCVAPIPNIDLQRKIGNLLHIIDEQIKNNSNMVEKLQVLSQTIFNKFFNNKIYEFNGILHDLCTLPSGFSFEPSYYVTGGKYKLITIKNVNGIFVDTDRVDTLNEIPSRMKDYCNLTKGDILISLTGNVGRISINSSSNCLLNQRVSKIVCSNDKYKFYLYLLLSTNYYQGKMQQMASGTSQKNLSPLDVENLRIFIPDNIDEFNNATKNILCQLCEINTFSVRLQDLKNKILPLLINRQIE